MAASFLPSLSLSCPIYKPRLTSGWYPATPGPQHGALTARGRLNASVAGKCHTCALLGGAPPPTPRNVTSGARGRAGRAGSAGRFCARCRTRLPPPIDPRSARSRAGECPRARPCAVGAEGPLRGRDNRKWGPEKRETPGNGDTWGGGDSRKWGPRKVVHGMWGLGALGEMAF